MSNTRTLEGDAYVTRDARGVITGFESVEYATRAAARVRDALARPPVKAAPAAPIAPDSSTKTPPAKTPTPVAAIRVASSPATDGVELARAVDDLVTSGTSIEASADSMAMQTLAAIETTRPKRKDSAAANVDVSSHDMAAAVHTRCVEEDLAHLASIVGGV